MVIYKNLSYPTSFFILSVRKETSSIEDLTFKLKPERWSDSFVKTLLKNILYDFALPFSSLMILSLSTNSGIAFLKFNLFSAYLKMLSG